MYQRRLVTRKADCALEKFSHGTVVWMENSRNLNSARQANLSTISSRKLPCCFNWWNRGFSTAISLSLFSLCSLIVTEDRFLFFWDGKTPSNGISCRRKCYYQRNKQIRFWEDVFQIVLSKHLSYLCDFFRLNRNFGSESRHCPPIVKGFFRNNFWTSKNPFRSG